MTALRTLSPAAARRLALVAQGLHAAPATPDRAALLETARRLGCLQLDPISVVARSHQLVLFSRVGAYALDDLDALLWEERALFEYWAHAASIVLTEDYPIHAGMMRAYPDGGPWGGARVRAWVRENDALRRHVLDEIAARGPLPSRYFTDQAEDHWVSTGWTSGRNVSQMLDYLWLSGALMVAGRQGGQKLWDLAERVLPHWTPRDELADEARVERAAARALKALGVARPRHIEQHFTRARYPGLPAALRRLEHAGEVERVEVAGDGKAWTGPWYVHREHVGRIRDLEQAAPDAGTRLLSPFDNLICDRARTELLFGFRYRIEIYTPVHKREFGYYVLPILHGDRLIGRIDPAFDRKQKRLVVNAVYAEADAPGDAATGRAVRGAVESLAGFLGARSIAFGDRLPGAWRAALAS